MTSSPGLVSWKIGTRNGSGRTRCGATVVWTRRSLTLSNTSPISPCSR